MELKNTFFIPLLNMFPVFRASSYWNKPGGLFQYELAWKIGTFYASVKSAKRQVVFTCMSDRQSTAADTCGTLVLGLDWADRETGQRHCWANTSYFAIFYLTQWWHQFQFGAIKQTWCPWIIRVKKFILISLPCYFSYPRLFLCPSLAILKLQYCFQPRPLSPFFYTCVSDCIRIT